MSPDQVEIKNRNRLPLLIVVKFLKCIEWHHSIGLTFTEPTKIPPPSERTTFNLSLVEIETCIFRALKDRGVVGVEVRTNLRGGPDGLRLGRGAGGWGPCPRVMTRQ